jgi:hypothetical protein
MIETRTPRDPRAEKLREWQDAQIERQEGLLEYVAIMADVELPEEDAEGVDDE